MKANKWLAISLILAIVNLWLSTYNTQLSYDLQTKQEEVAKLKEENQQLKDSINALKNKDRVISIATKYGLIASIDNVIYLK